MDVSIVIVNYNTKDLLIDCVESIIKNTDGLEYEILISDNGSLDGSVEAVESKLDDEWNGKVSLIKNGANLGFGAANNRALDQAKGKYIFYLNSDTVLENNAVKMFYDYWEEHDNAGTIGALGCQLKGADGNGLHSWGRYPTANGVLKALIHMWLVAMMRQPAKAAGVIDAINDDVEVEGYITGADLFVRNDECARFDERYFMYAEEADLEYNGYFKKGLKCIIINGPQIVHLEGASDKTKIKAAYDFNRRSISWLWMSNLKYIKKNQPNSKLQQLIIKAILKFIWRKNRQYLDELEAI